MHSYICVKCELSLYSECFCPDVNITFWTGLMGLRQVLRRRRLEEGVIQKLLGRPVFGVVQAETPVRKMK